MTPTYAVELLPCPFCGVRLSSEIDDGASFHIHLKNDCFFSEYEFDQLNIGQWNRRAPAEPMPSPSAITAWLETPDGKAAVVRAYAKLQGDIAGLNEARAVSHADLNKPMPSTASEDELALFEKWALTDDGNCNPSNLVKAPLGSANQADGVTFNNKLVERDWIVWQARAALAKPSTIASAENSGVRNAASPAAPALRDDDAASGKVDVEAERKDAARYRYLRNENNTGERTPYIVRDCKNTIFGPWWLHGEDADKAIDIAIAAATPGDAAKGDGQ